MCSKTPEDDNQPGASKTQEPRAVTDIPSKAGGKRKKKVHPPGATEEVSHGEDCKYKIELALQASCIAAWRGLVLQKELMDFKECSQSFDSIEGLQHPR